MSLKDWFKNNNDIQEPEDIARKARRISNDYEELVAKYDERTEELMELLREKATGLWDCKKYYQMALEFKQEIRALKKEVATLKQKPKPKQNNKKK